MINKVNGSFINGINITKGNKMVHVESPLNRDVISSVEIVSIEDFEKSVISARSSFQTWSKTSILERVKIFEQYICLLDSNKSEIAEIIHQENGKLIKEALQEIEESIELVKFACTLPQYVSKETFLSDDNIEYGSFREPIGVVASIVAFNYPFMLPHFTLANSLVLGNCMILRPSLKTPLSSLFIAHLLHKAGLPDGVLNVLIGENDIVDSICEHTDINAITFIGSSKIAKLVYQKATNNLKRCLALGGSKHHAIVLDDADPEKASSEIINSLAICAGQRCLSPSVLVAVGNIDNIIEKIILKANEKLPGKNLSPVVSLASKNRIIEYIIQAETSGAQILKDGRNVNSKLEGYNLGITILDNLKANSKVATEEIFGPVLSIIRVNNIEEAISITNNSKYGNAASIFTCKKEIIDLAIENIEVGMIGINKCIPSHKHLFSYGGVKESKYGACDINGKSSIEFWTRLRKIYLDSKIYINS